MSINTLEDDGTFDWVYRDEMLTVAYERASGKLRYDLAEDRSKNSRLHGCMPVQLRPGDFTAERVTELSEDAEHKLNHHLQYYWLGPVPQGERQQLHISFEQAKVALLRVLAPNV